MIDHGLWTRAFAADPDVIGRTVPLNRTLFTVVGVASEGTYSGAPITGGYIAPLGAEPLLRAESSRSTRGDSPWLSLIGRRDVAADLEQVRAELSVIAA